MRPTSVQSRLCTARSTHSTVRAQTARPPTAASLNHHGGNYIVAVFEGRGVAREVGLAALNKEIARVEIVQIADTQTYVKTIHHLFLHYPSIILLPDTSLSAAEESVISNKTSFPQNLLVHSIREAFPNVPLEPLLRKFWNDNAGLNFIDQLCIMGEDRHATMLAMSEKYYALSAACALFKYTELKHNTRFASGSLPIRYMPLDGTMFIDPSTIKNLEIIANTLGLKSKASLFGILNHTWTPMAERLLRTTLLAPLAATEGINDRLDAVEELIQAEDTFDSVRGALKIMNRCDLDKIIASLSSSEAKQLLGVRQASQRVSQLLALRNSLKCIPSVRDSVKGCRSRLLRLIYELFSDENLIEVTDRISQSLNENATASKGGGLNAVNARIYAVKANHNRLLDVARETFKENVGDIFKLGQSVCEEHGLPIQLIYQDTGFVFILKKSDLDDDKSFPPGFVNVVNRKGKYIFESLELKKRNARMKDALDEALILSDKIIEDLVSETLTMSAYLYKASEALALLDMLWSFAHVSILKRYVRPEFTGTLAIKAGRHPVLEHIQSAGSVVANDVYCCDSSSFQIIQGPNMSGKSTYIRQIGLLTVMAMSGCFVPAEYASFRIHDSLLSRLSNDEDLEKSLSTFANEISTTAMILGLVTPRSLVLVDELGRGTSPREGLGIACAIAEQLIGTECFVFFTTHFSDLSQALGRCPSVVNLYLAVQKTRPSASNIGLIFQHKILDGQPESIEHYGLELARLADLPQDVLSEAWRISKKMKALELKRESDSTANQIAIRRKTMLRLRTQLTQALEHSALPNADLMAYLARLQRDTAAVIRNTLVDAAMIESD